MKKQGKITPLTKLPFWPHPALRTPTLYTLWVFWHCPRFKSLHWETCMKFKILIDGFIFFFICSQFLFSISWRKEDNFLNIKCVNTIWLFWHRPRVRTPTSGDMKFKILVEGFLVYKIMNSVFLTGVWE